MNEDKPTKETLENRKAGDSLMREAAQKGNGIAGAYFELESIANKQGLGITRIVDYDDEDWDDIRPY